MLEKGLLYFFPCGIVRAGADRVMAEKKWLTNVARCSIPEVISGIWQHLEFDIDLDTYYSTNQSSFGAFKESDPQSNDRKIIFQLYWRLLERIKEEAIKKLSALQKKNKGKNNDDGDDMDNANSKPIQLSSADGIDDDDSIDGSGSDGSDGEDITGGGDDMSDEAEESEEEGKKKKQKGKKKKQIKKKKKTQDSDEEEEYDNEKKFDVYIETKVGTDYDGKGEPKTITGYRFFAVVFDKSLDANKIFADLVTSIISYNKSMIYGRRNRSDDGSNETNSNSNSNDKKEYGRPGMTEQWGLWQTISSRSMLAGLADLYAGVKRAIENLDDVERKALNDNKNPLHATEVFNFGWALHITMKGARPTHKRQTVDNWKGYFRKGKYDGLYELRFPLRKMVYKMQWGDVSPHVIHSKYIPHMDRFSIKVCVSMLSALLEDTKIFAHDDDDDEKDKEAEKSELMEKKITDEKAESDHLKMNAAFQYHTKTVRTIQGYKPFDKKDLATVRWSIVDEILGLKSLRDTIVSCYGPIYVYSKKNMSKIRELNARRNDLPFLKNLNNSVRVTRVMYLLNQQQVFGNYIINCTTGKSAVSPCAKKLLEYAQTHNLYENDFEPEEKYDPTLSTFSDWDAKFYRHLEKTYKLIASFPTASLAYKNSLDAYALHLDRVHNHMITYSKGGSTGKSFAWRLVVKWRIPGTVNWLTYETGRSRATDEEDCNDEIVIFDEFEQAMVDKTGGGNNDKERTFKQLLATNKVCAKVLVIDPTTGKRSTKITYSECITVFFGSTNVSFDLISEAMQRRFQLIVIDEQPHKKRSILEEETTGKASGESTKDVYVANMNKKFHLIQVLVFHVEKLIYLGGLKEVSMDVGNIVILYLSNELMIGGYSEPNPTMYERVMTTARCNSILDAVNKLFFYKGAKYSKKFIDINYLKDLDPLLYCTTEHIMGAISETIDVIIDPLEFMIKQSLRIIHKEAEANEQKYKVVVKSNGEKKVFVTLANTLRFACKGKKTTLAVLISSIIINRFENAKLRPSIEAITQRLDGWTKRQFRAYKYEFARNKKGMLEKPERVYVDIPYTREFKNIAGWDHDYKAYFVDYEFLFPGMGKVLDEKLAEIGKKSSLSDRSFYNHLSITNLEEVINSSIDINSCDAFEQYGVPLPTDGNEPISRDIFARSHTKDEQMELVQLTDEEIKDKSKIEEIHKYMLNHPRYNEIYLDMIRSKRIKTNSNSNNSSTYLLDYHDKYSKLDADMSPDEVVESIFKDILSKRYQLDCRICTTSYIDHPSVRRVLEVEHAKENAEFLLIPVVNSIRDIDKKLLKNIGNYVDPLNEMNIWMLDCDLDTYGFRQRKKAIFWTSDPIDPKVLTDNPMETLLAEEDEPKEDQDGDMLGILNLQENSRDALCISKDSKLLPTGEGQEDGSDMAEDVYEDMVLGENSPRNDPSNIFALSEDEESSDDEGVSQFDRGGLLPGNEDDDYDMDVGYLQGVGLDKLYSDSAKSFGELTERGIKKIYKRLDTFNSDRIFDDVDFDPRLYVISIDENGEPLYHWDIIARDNGGVHVDVFLKDEKRKKKKKTKKHQEQNDEDEKTDWVYVPKDHPISIDDKCAVLKHNVRIYKQIFAHPRVMKDFENRKYYTENIGNSYPKDFLTKTPTTRKDRWMGIKEISKSQDKVKDQMLEDNDIFSFGYKIVMDEQGHKKILENDKIPERLVYNSYSPNKKRSMPGKSNSHCIYSHAYSRRGSYQTQEKGEEEQERKSLSSLWR